MNTALITMAGSLTGVIVGGLLSQLGDRRTLRLQNRLAMATEQRERLMASAAVAIGSASKLLLLDDAPYEPEDIAHFYDRKSPQQQSTEFEINAWEAGKWELVLVLETAALDLSVEIRRQLSVAIDILRVGKTSHTGRLESQQRKAACEYALDCLGAFRRGESIPRGI